jgi:GNAT superfamily N-acetyltransferase
MARPDPSGFSIEPAADTDWPWLLERHADSIWDNLPSLSRANVGIDVVRRRAREQWNRLRQRAERADQALVARDENGTRAGFVWVEATQSGFTGEPLALVRDVFVETPIRGQGLGTLLMEAAEKWARERNLGRMFLSVIEHNHIARRLYEALGYSTEVYRMGKVLVDPERRPDQ